MNGNTATVMKSPNEGEDTGEEGEQVGGGGGVRRGESKRWSHSKGH